MVNKLAVFDLDGTLIDSQTTDTDCFVETFRLEFGCVVDDDWAVYQDCTDEGIVREALGEHFGRAPTDREMARFRTRFEELLEVEFANRSESLSEISGACELLAELGRRGWFTCIATGAWSFSARLKLAAAQVIEHPLVYSSDLDSTREGIVRAAVAATLEEHSLSDFDRIVAVGDGVWDVRTAARLGLPLLAVGQGAQAHRLIAAGARHVIADFSDLAATVAALETVGPPLSSKA